MAAPRAFVLGLGPSKAVLWSYQRVVRCVTVFACFTYLVSYKWAPSIALAPYFPEHPKGILPGSNERQVAVDA